MPAYLRHLRRPQLHELRFVVQEKQTLKRLSSTSVSFPNLRLKCIIEYSDSWFNQNKPSMSYTASPAGKLESQMHHTQQATGSPKIQQSAATRKVTTKPPRPSPASKPAAPARRSTWRTCFAEHYATPLTTQRAFSPTSANITTSEQSTSLDSAWSRVTTSQGRF